MDQIALLGAGKVKNALGVELTKVYHRSFISEVTFMEKFSVLETNSVAKF